MLRTTLSTFFVAVLLISFSCNKDDQAPTPQSVKELTGVVKDGNNNLYPNTLVKLFNGTTTLETRTNVMGSFSFDTQSTGAFQVTIIPPLATVVTSQDTVGLTIQKDVESTVDFILQAPNLTADIVTGAIDIFGEIRDQNGMIPSDANEPLYARNVFDPPIGKLTPITNPDNQQVILSEWESAQGTVKVICNGNTSTVDLSLQGMIPNGTYTLWCDFLNKIKHAGDPINLNNDVVSIEPLGSGTLNVVIAGNDGSINATINHPSCMLTREVALVMVVVYHINGNTFGTAHIPDEEDVSHMLVYFQ